MRILILGGTGQIGHELLREMTTLGTIVAPSSAELDLRSASAIHEAMARERPDLVINAAGYTAVDAAETEPELCAAINAQAPGVLAEVAREQGASLVHFSTDYVFDGTKRTPYVETDEPGPLSVYGRTKLEGERAVASAGGAFLIFRTSWIYAARGKNFARTILRLARERNELAVVNDQVGAPTAAAAIAAGVAQVLRVLAREPDLRAAVESAAGIYHLTASGSTTWYEFARAILADDSRTTIRPITTAEYPTAARRPAYSVLDNAKVVERFGVRLREWREQWTAAKADPSLRSG